MEGAGVSRPHIHRINPIRMGRWIALDSSFDEFLSICCTFVDLPCKISASSTLDSQFPELAETAILGGSLYQQWKKATRNAIAVEHPRTELVTQFPEIKPATAVASSECGPNYSAVGIGVFFISLIAFMSLMVVPPSSVSPW